MYLKIFKKYILKKTIEFDSMVADNSMKIDRAKLIVMAGHGLSNDSSESGAVAASVVQSPSR